MQRERGRVPVCLHGACVCVLERGQRDGWHTKSIHTQKQRKQRERKESHLRNSHILKRKGKRRREAKRLARAKSNAWERYVTSPLWYGGSCAPPVDRAGCGGNPGHCRERTRIAPSFWSFVARQGTVS